MRSSSLTHCLQSSLWKWYASKLKNSFTKEKSEKPRVVLRANSHCGLQDLPRQEARSSWETQSDAQSFQETGCNIVDFWVPGISLTSVQQQNEQRQHTVAKLIEMFESHQHKEQFLKDMSQTPKINGFSEASQKLLQDDEQTEIFELCENATKLQCSDCNYFTEIGMGDIWSTRGVLQQNSKRITTFLQSLATSLRRILVEDQSTVDLRDKNYVLEGERCGGVLFGQEAQLLNWSARAFYPRHQGSRRCKAAGRAGR